ncbi:SidA/IucD/PvdA family monooxygenase [Erwinia tasmaniensis]|uniref:SidA/IucD/PvdA family monooxygenase n=1 Tax=Erwinia tasmaniensis TaxID=338565 RepID=UPI003A4D7F5E
MDHTYLHDRDSFCDNKSNYDVVNVGFGPAGIALACVQEDAKENNSSPQDIKMLHLEKSDDTVWHGELLLSGTDINHSVFRDLVTPRNPRSRFSFAMYLKDKNRMFDFGLLSRPASRHEWSDYIRWVSSQVDKNTLFSTPAKEILPVVEGGELHGLKVVTEHDTYLTKNIVLSSGSQPHIPDKFLPYLGERVFHTSHFLSCLKRFGEALPARWLVLGSGQSASESVIELLKRREDITLHSVHRSPGFRLTQLGHFPNRVFSPEHVDYFHQLDNVSRRKFLEWSNATNYAGIDPDESQTLFSFVYEDRICGRERLLIRPYSEVVDVRQSDNGYKITLADIFSGKEEIIEVDVIVLATGYQQARIPALLTQLQPWLAQDQDGGLLIERNYRVALRETKGVNIYVNGLSERSHGISDSQSFSLMALRAEKIMKSLPGSREEN